MFIWALAELYAVSVSGAAASRTSKLAWSPRNVERVHNNTSSSSPRQTQESPQESIGALITHRSALTESTALDYSDDGDNKIPTEQGIVQPRQPAAASPVRLLRRQHNEELLRVLEQEQDREQERVDRLAECTDTKEKARLETIFAAERTKASEDILALSLKHEKELDTVTQHE